MHVVLERLRVVSQLYSRDSFNMYLYGIFLFEIIFERTGCVVALTS